MMTREHSLPWSSQSNHLVSMLMERTELLNCTKQLQLGSKHSDIRMRTSSTNEVLSWKYKETNAKRDNQFLLGKSIMVRIKDGSSDMERTMEVTSKEKERMATSDSSLMNHFMLGVKQDPN
jgi:hypothetical protein